MWAEKFFIVALSISAAGLIWAIGYKMGQDDAPAVQFELLPCS